MKTKAEFETALRAFSDTLTKHVSTGDGQWTVKGFIDIYKNIYTISSDSKIVSKIIEIHILPEIISFADAHGFSIVLAEHQNYYPDISFVLKEDDSVRFAVDIKTTYRLPIKYWLCNGFTLGSHGKYFQERKSTKNIQFPYASYAGHFCLGIIYDRCDKTAIDETHARHADQLHSIASVISNIQFFVAEKWKIAGDKSGSGNTANIGSIQRIDDILAGKGMFSRLGEEWFDDYWMNYGKIIMRNPDGKISKITSLVEFVKYRGGDVSLVVPRDNQQ
jgi:hypothetical protein